MYLGSNKVELGQNASGGGSSDFSTAQVTVVSNDEYVDDLYLAAIADDSIWIWNSPSVGTYTVPLFNGSYNTFYNSSSFAQRCSVDGNATMDEFGNITITGDCTITIS